MTSQNKINCQQKKNSDIREEDYVMNFLGIIQPITRNCLRKMWSVNTWKTRARLLRRMEEKRFQFCSDGAIEFLNQMTNKPDKANIREALASPSESLRTKFRTYKDVLQHSFTHGSHYSDSSSETCKQISHKRVEPTDAHRHVHSCSVGVQDSLPNRRYLQVTKKGCNSPEPYKHCSTYGKQNKNYKDATFSPRLFCGNRRCVYPSDIHPSSQIETQSKNLSGKHSKGSEFSQKASGSGVFLTFDEARSRALPDETSGTEETNIGRSNEPRKPQERNHSTPILRKIGNDGTRLRNTMGDTFPLNSKKNLMSYWDTQQKDVAPRKKVIWTRTIRKSSMATPEQFNIPLHAPKVQPIDLSTAIQHMKPEVGTRFTDVWKNITMPHFPILNNIGILPRSNGSLSHTDIKQLSENGIIERVSYVELRSNPTKGKVLPSTVVEERNGVKRRRFICWPKHQNAILQNTYVAHVPIDQPGSYAESVRSPCAVKRDLKSSFYQVALPQHSKCFYRFRYGDATYQLTRMPMGHCCAPEIQQILTGVVAGDPKYTKDSIMTESSLKNGNIDIYIDGIRYTGAQHQCKLYENWLETRAKKLNATFKEEESYCGPKYDFLGVSYDHDTQCFRLAELFVNKIPHDIPDVMPMHQLESLCARLLYASGILQVLIPKYYWTIKFVRRQVSKLNKGKIRDTDHINMPPTVCHLLKKWIQEIRLNKWQHQPRRIDIPEAVLFTDASLDGWGAVLICPDGAVYGGGAPWESDMEINYAEATATEKALITFKDHWARWKNIRLCVDNTSVKYAIAKQWSDSYNISTVLIRILNFINIRGIKIAAHYVETNANLADPWSRNRYGTWRKDGMVIVSKGDWRRGGCRLPSR